MTQLRNWVRASYLDDRVFVDSSLTRCKMIDADVASVNAWRSEVGLVQT